MPIRTLTILATCIATLSVACANQVSESQQQYIKKYEKQDNTPAPGDMLINIDPEPNLDQAGFVNLYNGSNLDGWTPLGGHCTFEPHGEVIVGTTVKGSPSTYLSTDKDDYTNFIFTAELKWAVDGNSGVMFRAQQKPNKKKGITVYGPQCEMEGTSLERGWSGGIYGQSAGGWSYPLWLNAHDDVRKAIQPEGWNRVTIQAIGSNIKTWINGTPAANWETDDYVQGFFSLQVHSGKKGEIHFRNIKVKELKPQGQDLFASGDFSAWTNLKGQPIGKGWSIEDGIIHRQGKRPGDIITRKHYENFDLSFDWKISEEGNSGVKYRTKGALGLEYQILDDAKHKDRHNPTHRTGSLYELAAAPDSKPVNPVGEWNHARIVANGDNIQHWLNGVKVIDIEYGSDDWDQRFQKSKYSEHSDFSKGAGPILLQDHNDEVWFKNVQIREL